MKLSGNLFDTIDQAATEGQIHSSIRLNHNCEIYRGHFPGNPITPGVIMMGIARELVEVALGIKLKLGSVPSVKYTYVLNPTEHESVTYDICYQLDGNQIKGKVTITDRDTVFARMSLVWNLQN